MCVCVHAQLFCVVVSSLSFSSSSFFLPSPPSLPPFSSAPPSPPLSFLIHPPPFSLLLSPSSFLQIFSGLMTLRKLCNHPDLVTNDFSELVRNEKGEGEEEEGDFEILNVPGRKKKKWPLRG